jgi:hypothetical protein
MGFEAGRLVWIPCEVKPGPFSDERIIRIPSERGDWVAFVHVNELRNPVSEGSTFVRAVILSVEGGRFKARIAGEPVGSSVFEGALSRIEPIAAPTPAGILALAVASLAEIPASECDLLTRKLEERER